MFKSKIWRISTITFLIIINVACDQVTKSVVRRNVNENEYIPIIKDYFTMTKIENNGAFLSLGDTLSEPIRFIFLTLLPVIFLLVGTVLLFIKSNLSKLVVIGFSFVLGGGVGNLYDRLTHGSVTDFLHIDFVIFQTGIFNLADVSIMVGMGLVLIDSFKSRPEISQTEM